MFYWMNSLSRYMTYKFLGNLKFLGSKFLWFRNLETCLELEKETISDALPLEVASIAPVVLGFNEEFHVAPAYQILAKSDNPLSSDFAVSNGGVVFHLIRPPDDSHEVFCFTTDLSTALHAMQTRSSDEKAVRPSVSPSVRLSNAWIVTKRKKDLSRFLHHTRDHLA